MRVKHCLFAIAIGLQLTSGPVTSQEYESTTLFFPEIAYKHILHESPKTTQESDTNVALTAVHVGKYQALNSLIEVHINEHHENIERFQIGFDYANTHKVWFGRGHTPAGYWNTEYHHGGYLETSLSRPAPTLTVWPRHLTGISLEGSLARFDEKIQYSLLAGLAPIRGHHSLEDFDIVDWDDGNHLGITGRLSYAPDPLTGTEIGIFAGYYDINSQVDTIADFEKTLAGAFINWEQGDHRVISEIFYINSNISADTVTGDKYFLTGYAQYEQILNSSFTAYGRIEEAFNENDAIGFKLHSGFTKAGRIAGLRYDFLGNQALKVEAASIRKVSGKQIDSISLKWDAVFP